MLSLVITMMFAWAKFVQGQLAYDLEVEVGDLIWTATNLPCI